jgi:magnesium transporter
MRIDTTRRISQRDLEAAIGIFTDPYPYSFHLEQTIEEVLKIIQTTEVERRTEYFYITDKKQFLKGFITLADLLYNPFDRRLSEIVDRNVLKVYEDEPLEKGLKFLAHHQLLIAPVVNRENRLIGVLEIIPNTHRFFESKKIHYKHLKEDVFQFIGFSIEHRKWDSPWTEYRLRMPWLFFNLAGGLICAAISKFYKLTLEQYVVLAFFIPLVLTLSEAAAIQSMTLSFRFLHLRRVYWKQIWRRSYVEMQSSLMLGITCAILIGLFYFAWSVDIKPVTGIVVSVVAAMIAAGLCGALFPIILHALKLDPKVAAGPVVLMMADIITIAIYLTLTTLILI